MPVPEILAIIPARSGSKSVPHKNIREVGGKPLLVWSIEHAAASRRITRAIVSTDSRRYAALARRYGAETPFLRPMSLAEDDTPDLPVFRHALRWLEIHEDYRPEICVHLRPTCPVRDPAVIDKMVDLLLARPDLDSVRTVTPVLHPPFKMWYRDSEGLLSPVVKHLDHVVEPWNEPRQCLPPTYLQSANIDVIRVSAIVDKGSMTGDRIWGYVEQDFHDIDTPAELERASAVLGHKDMDSSNEPSLTLNTASSFCFDIDGVIAALSPENNYVLARPNPEVIEMVNKLYAAGHHVTLFTARGSATGIDWEEVTRGQLAAWGVHYHVLRFGKPAADYYIDDRSLSLKELKRLDADHKGVLA